MAVRTAALLLAVLLVFGALWDKDLLAADMMDFLKKFVLGIAIVSYAKLA
jgi:hypothetical protein